MSQHQTAEKKSTISGFWGIFDNPSSNAAQLASIPLPIASGPSIPPSRPSDSDYDDDDDGPPPLVNTSHSSDSDDDDVPALAEDSPGSDSDPDAKPVAPSRRDSSYSYCQSELEAMMAHKALDDKQVYLCIFMPPYPPLMRSIQKRREDALRRKEAQRLRRLEQQRKRAEEEPVETPLIRTMRLQRLCEQEELKVAYEKKHNIQIVGLCARR
jgi:hypothetical protein